MIETLIKLFKQHQTSKHLLILYMGLMNTNPKTSISQKPLRKSNLNISNNI